VLVAKHIRAKAPRRLPVKPSATFKLRHYPRAARVVGFGFRLRAHAAFPKCETISLFPRAATAFTAGHGLPVALAASAMTSEGIVQPTSIIPDGQHHIGGLPVTHSHRLSLGRERPRQARADGASRALRTKGKASALRAVNARSEAWFRGAPC
jgi:hypothetical protein